MNVKNTTAKEVLLRNIRQALLTKTEPRQDSVPALPLYKKEEELVDITFVRELTENGGKFLYCEGEIALVENLISLAEENNIKQIYLWEKGIQKLLDLYGFPYISTEAGVEHADAGITSCEALIARSGSVLISNANASGRRLSVFPAIQIVIARASQFVWDLKDGLSYIQKRYGRELPSMISVVTGPARSVDPVQPSLVGVYGPRELYVLLLEDRF